jgi:hypothetical protein
VTAVATGTPSRFASDPPAVIEALEALLEALLPEAAQKADALVRLAERSDDPAVHELAERALAKAAHLAADLAGIRGNDQAERVLLDVVTRAECRAAAAAAASAAAARPRRKTVEWSDGRTAEVVDEPIGTGAR